MKLTNKYYFEFALNFEKDFNVGELESVLGLKASKLVSYENSKAENKTAKFIFKTEEISEIYADFEFKKFLNAYKDKLKGVTSLLKDNNGNLAFCVVFTELQDKPIISLDRETIQILSDLNASFDVDYVS